MFEALRKTNLNILQNIYSQATGRIHLDKNVSGEFPINIAVRQEIHSHRNYSLLLQRKSLRRQTSLKESLSMEKTIQA